MVQGNDVSEFLGNEGAIGLLFSIDTDEGTPVTEIEENVSVSSGTFRKRMNTAEELELVTDTVIRAGDHGNTEQKTLTEKGEAIREALEALDTDSKRERWLRARRGMDRDLEILDDYLNALVQQPNVIEEIRDDLKEDSATGNYQKPETDKRNQ